MTLSVTPLPKTGKEFLERLQPTKPADINVMMRLELRVLMSTEWEVNGFLSLIGSTSKEDSPNGKVDDDRVIAAYTMKTRAKGRDDCPVTANAGTNQIKRNMRMVMKKGGFLPEQRIQIATEPDAWQKSGYGDVPSPEEQAEQARQAANWAGKA